MRFRRIVLPIAMLVILAVGFRYQASTHQMDKQNFAGPNHLPESLFEAEQDLSQSILSRKKIRPMSVLLLGLDSRAGEPARADTIMLAVCDPEHAGVNVIQIPRDTCVKIPGRGYTKINHAMTYGGPELMKRTVEEWLKNPVDHTVVVDFAGFRKLVDLLGGLPIHVEKNMDYDDPSDGTHIHLRKGEQVLNGKQALDYARFRYDPEADTGRMRRQQQVLRVLIDKGMTIDTFPKTFQILEILGDHLKTSIPPGELWLLAKSYYRFNPSVLQTESIQGVNQVAPEDGLWYFFVERDEQERLQKLLANWLHSGSTSRDEAP
ncbi:LCP family protein [Effusibacillus consociatus]|uniref:LCP family protein n=1 Tax=Effusibacillus consociatus TaxID=1117041 RepID=A0ABV9Q839_9BACL